MAEMEQPGQEAPAEGAAPQSQGGGIAEAFVDVDGKLSKLVQAAQQAEQVPDEAKQAFGAALEAWRAGLQALTQAASGARQAGGAASPEAGAAQGAVPMSPAGVQR